MHTEQCNGARTELSILLTEVLALRALGSKDDFHLDSKSDMSNGSVFGGFRAPCQPTLGPSLFILESY